MPGLLLPGPVCKMNWTRMGRVEWKCLEADPEWIETFIAFELEEKDDQTILRFTHGNWKKDTDFYATCNYHWGHYMKSIKDYCETGKGQPYKI